MSVKTVYKTQSKRAQRKIKAIKGNKNALVLKVIRAELPLCCTTEAKLSLSHALTTSDLMRIDLVSLIGSTNK